MAQEQHLARRLWEVIEPLHAVVYFAPGPAEDMKALGLRGWWMGYFAGRFAPMGEVTPETVTAVAFGFAPAMVARAIPDAWRITPPGVIVPTRLQSAADALERALPGGAFRQLDELDRLLWTAVGACGFDGRPLAAAWSGVVRPADAIGSVWLAATVLREHRGDGHVLAAVAAGLTGLETSISHVATGATRRDVVQPNRGWTDDAWTESVQRLQARGLLDREGRLTNDGKSVRRNIELSTDRLASGPVDALGEGGIGRVLEIASPLAFHIVDSGQLPVPNPIGVSRP